MTKGVQVFLANSPADAARLAPATIISGWDDCPGERIRTYLAAAVRLSQMVNRRLDRLQAVTNKSAAWNAAGSPEDLWFGDYSDAKLNKVRRTFQGITRHLSSTRLEVTTRGWKTYYGMAIPLIEKIALGRAWHYPGLGPDDDAERVQTFVHEASHICGRFSAAEAKAYGRGAAQALTRWRMRATRNADNYGYYALDVLDLACTF
ncbi:MAG TPA: M35 family metallo-endopeptidase [Vineibacter sp.]|nr:M35 family metallo-endopeptidase [Vineibacter sp.]